MNKQNIKKAWEWLVWSSKDPKKVSLFIKGLGASAAIYIPFASHWFGLPGLTVDSWNLFTDDLAQTIGNWLTIVALGVSTWGGVRKCWNTVKSWLYNNFA